MPREIEVNAVFDPMKGSGPPWVPSPKRKADIFDEFGTGNAVAFGIEALLSKLNPEIERVGFEDGEAGPRFILLGGKAPVFAAAVPAEQESARRVVVGW